jgi:hypothetical protein
VVVTPDVNNPLNTTIIQTNTKPSTYGIYFTTVGSNRYNTPLFETWYLVK